MEPINVNGVEGRRRFLFHLFNGIKFSPFDDFFSSWEPKKYLMESGLVNGVDKGQKSCCFLLKTAVSDGRVCKGAVPASTAITV